MLCIGSEHEYLMATHEDAIYPHALSPPNAAHEWQAKSLQQRKELVAACPLDGLVSFAMARHFIHSTP